MLLLLLSRTAELHRSPLLLRPLAQLFQLLGKSPALQVLETDKTQVAQVIEERLLCAEKVVMLSWTQKQFRLLQLLALFFCLFDRLEEFLFLHLLVRLEFSQVLLQRLLALRLDCQFQLLLVALHLHIQFSQLSLQFVDCLHRRQQLLVLRWDLHQRRKLLLILRLTNVA